MLYLSALHLSSGSGERPSRNFFPAVLLTEHPAWFSPRAKLTTKLHPLQRFLCKVPYLIPYSPNDLSALLFRVLCGLFSFRFVSFLFLFLFLFLFFLFFLFSFFFFFFFFFLFLFSFLTPSYLLPLHFFFLLISKILQTIRTLSDTHTSLPHPLH